MRKLIDRVMRQSQRNTRNADRNESLLDGCIESLEKREMLAGNVAVDISAAGDVNIVGDDAANSISLVNTPNGLFIDGSNTTITFEGVTAENHVLRIGPNDGVDRDLNFAMHKGNDSIRVDGVDVGRHIDAKLGQGHDFLRVTNGEVGQNIYVKEGTGRYADAVQINDMLVGRTLNVQVGDAPNDVSDEFFFTDSISVANTEIGSRMTLIGKRGFTEIEVDSVHVVSHSKVFSGDGEDYVSVSNSQFDGNTTINTGGRDDSLLLSGPITAGGNFRTFLGNGDDFQRMDLDGSSFGDFVKHTGNKGFDTMEILSIDASYESDPIIIQFEA